MSDNNQVAVVTGATGTIGSVIVRQFLARGVRVVAAARSARQVDVVRLFGPSAGAQVTAKSADVVDEIQAMNLVDFAADQFGRLDFLVNAAGTYGSIGLARDVSPAAWKTAIDTNLMGSYNCCHYALRHMTEARRGSIINVAGGGSTGPLQNLSSYAASKAALVRLTDTIAQEVAPFGVTANAILPGAVDSAMQDQLLAAGEKAGPWYPKIKELRESGGGGVPATLTAQLLDFLLFGAGSSLTGKLISARYDHFASWGAGEIAKLASSDLLSLRRLDPATLTPILKIESLFAL